MQDEWPVSKKTAKRKWNEFFGSGKSSVRSWLQWNLPSSVWKISGQQVVAVEVSRFSDFNPTTSRIDKLLYDIMADDDKLFKLWRAVQLLLSHDQGIRYFMTTLTMLEYYSTSSRIVLERKISIDWKVDWLNQYFPPIFPLPLSTTFPSHQPSYACSPTHASLPYCTPLPITYSYLLTAHPPPPAGYECHTELWIGLVWACEDSMLNILLLLSAYATRCLPQIMVMLVMWASIVHGLINWSVLNDVAWLIGGIL